MAEEIIYISVAFFVTAEISDFYIVVYMSQLKDILEFVWVEDVFGDIDYVDRGGEGVAKDWFCVELGVDVESVWFLLFYP
jgi:hypothetical protein